MEITSKWNDKIKIGDVIYIVITNWLDIKINEIKVGEIKYEYKHIFNPWDRSVYKELPICVYVWDKETTFIYEDDLFIETAQKLHPTYEYWDMLFWGYYLNKEDVNKYINKVLNDRIKEYTTDVEYCKILLNKAKDKLIKANELLNNYKI